ncbi:MAG: hypothetical protein U1D55_07015 [Phycisphaerae bacterium]
MKRSYAAAVAWMAISLCAAALRAQTVVDCGTRIERLNCEFLDQLATLPADRAMAVEAVRLAWRERDTHDAGESFIPDALAALYPAYAEALAAFDEGRSSEAARAFQALQGDSDAYLAATALYFHCRSLIESGLTDDAGALLKIALADESTERHTPLAPHLWLMLASCQFAGLEYADAAAALDRLVATYPDAPEPIVAGARQLRLETDRRERGTLEEVAQVMSYVAQRLRVADARPRVRTRQGEIVEMLDKMIKESEQREQQQRAAAAARAARGGAGQKGGKKQPGAHPGRPAEESEATPGGAAPPPNLRAAQTANPGEMWGKLPPAERERILQSLKDRFPSRYRQLVEQYYRSLAEDK